MFQGRYTSPVDERLTSIRVNQSDDPWWIFSILCWLGSYKGIVESQWDGADVYRQLLEDRLEKDSPEFLYKFYKDFTTFLKADISSKKNR